MTIQEISNLRKNQGDWHGMHLPVYLVQKKVRQYGFQPGYADEFIWLQNGEEIFDQELIRELNEADENWRKWDALEDSHQYTKVYFKEDWEFVTLFFSEQGARDYISLKRGRDEKLRLYVDSAFDNWELGAVIGMLEGKNKVTINQFRQFCKENGPKAAALKLREWVNDDQPDGFCDGYTVRALCREASNAITGENAGSCADSKFGAELYAYARRLTEELPGDETK